MTKKSGVAFVGLMLVAYAVSAEEFCGHFVSQNDTRFHHCVRGFVEGTNQQLLDEMQLAVDIVSPETYPVLSEAIIAPSVPQGTAYTVDLGWSERSNFKVFGVTSGSRPIGTAVLTVERDDWALDLIAVQGVGEQFEEELVKYGDLILTRSFERGDWTTTVGLELFYGPAQLGLPSSTFIAPLATIEWTGNDHFSVIVGGQYTGTHNTDYTGQDRSFAWLEPTFSVGDRLALSISPGVVYADTGRSTQYLEGSLEWAATESFTLYASYLEADSWDIVGVEGPLAIRPTWTYGITINF